MNQSQSRQFLNLKLRTRNKEAKCKALMEDKLLCGLFSQDIQQMHYEVIQSKLAMASTAKKISKAHNNVLVDVLNQYSKTIKSNTHLLQTINSQVCDLMDKEKDMLETQEETVLGIRDAIDSEFDSIIDCDKQEQIESQNSISRLLPSVPAEEPSQGETVKLDSSRRISFGNVIIKTVDQVEEEKQNSEENDACDTGFGNFTISENNDENEESINSLI